MTYCKLLINDYRSSLHFSLQSIYFTALVESSHALMHDRFLLSSCLLMTLLMTKYAIISFKRRDGFCEKWGHVFNKFHCWCLVNCIDLKIISLLSYLYILELIIVGVWLKETPKLRSIPDNIINKSFDFDMNDIFTEFVFVLKLTHSSASKYPLKLY